jgi:hypothetical protein
MNLFLAQNPSLDGTVDLIQFGFMGIALLWFAMGKVHPDSIIKDLKAQLEKSEAAREAESKDAKAVRDVIIRDVVPAMVLSAEQSKEVVVLTERLLASVIRLEGR